MRQSNSAHRVFYALLAVFIIIIIGTAGYYFIEGWPILDSLYMTVITLSTVGYREVHDLSTAGRFFTIGLIFAGVGTLLYALTSFVSYFLEGEFGFRIGRRRMENKIGKLSNHYIICGFGRVGESVAKALKREKADFVAIEMREDCVNRALEDGFLIIKGDATDNEMLQQAGIERAHAVIVAFGDDAHNLYAVITAHDLNPKIQIIARASTEDAGKRMRSAGAEHVIAPEHIGGEQMARLAIRPAAVQFVETVFSGKGEELIIEELDAGAETDLIGATVKEIENRYPRVKILALKNSLGSVIINPGPDTVIERTHSLTAFGPMSQMQKLETCCQARR